MPFVKVIKNRAYFKRFQTKPRRRREGKTDYKARRRMIAQDKNKYNCPKYRFVVRRTNTDVVCQVVKALVQGDEVVAAAYGHELPRYGAKVGLTSYAGHYATGLLCARRLLDKLNLADSYEGNTNVDGSYYEVEESGDARPFKALLDIGLARTTTGARIFGALKGAADGGLNIPHGENRFPGFDKGSSELKSEVHRQRIFGLHVAEYQRTLLEEEEEKYNTVFSRYKASGITPDNIEQMWKDCHAAIRKDPKGEKKQPKSTEHKSYAVPRRTTVQRKHRALQKKMAFLKRQLAD